MAQNKYFLFISLFPTLLSFGACGGVKSRIQENQRQFAQYPPEIQSQIQNGRIDHGFTEEMVFIAKGKPTDKTQINRDGKAITVWKYVGAMPSEPPGQSTGGLASPYGYPGFGPGPNQPAPMFYERKTYKVEFQDGKVVSWDPDFQRD